MMDSLALRAVLDALARVKGMKGDGWLWNYVVKSERPSGQLGLLFFY
jgi:hypothetical protein